MMETGQRYAQNEQEGDLEEYQQQSSFKKIEELENHGVNKTDIIKLKAGGYHTIEAVSGSIYCCERISLFISSRLLRLHMAQCGSWLK